MRRARSPVRPRAHVVPNYDWSPKQQRALSMWERDSRYVLLDGSVRSGKTFSGLYGWLNGIARNFAGYDFLLSARTMKQFRAVLEANLLQWCRDTGVAWRKVESEYIIQSEHGANRFIPSLGNDAGAMDKIVGLTLAGAFLDEAPLMPQDYVDQVGLRCSVEGAKIVTTDNPQGPLHWFKQEYIDNASDINAEWIHFELRDNPSLPESYFRQVETQFTGAFYRRMVLGEWTATSGAIYPHALDAVSPVPRRPPTRYWVAIDVASSGVTHAGLIAEYSDGKSWLVGEWRYDGRDQGQMRDVDQVKAIRQDLVGDRNVHLWIIDPAAAAFRAELADQLGDHRKIRMAENDVLEGIQRTSRWLQEGWLNIAPSLRSMRNGI